MIKAKSDLAKATKGAAIKEGNICGKGRVCLRFCFLGRVGKKFCVDH